MEQLEDRALLSVSAAEYASIREAHPALNLPENSSSINVIEIKASNLSVDSIQAAIESAGKTQKDDLIVVRTSNSAYKATFADKSDRIDINVDSAKYGALNVVALGTRPLTINANELSRVVNITSGKVGLGNLRIVGGKTSGNGAGLYLRNGELTTSNVTFKNNAATYNEAKESGSGGAVFVASGSFSALNATFSDNSARLNGGAVCVKSGTFAAVDSTFARNTSDENGAGVCVENGTFTATRSSISNNSASLCGGGVYVAAQGTFNAINTTISENSAINQEKDVCGGGVYIEGGTFTATNGTAISNNSATNGGAVYVKSGMFTATNTTIVRNSSLRNGGGVYVATNGTFTAIGATISDNSIKTQDDYLYGGGVYVDGGAFIARDGTTISNNSTSFYGGGVYLRKGNFTATNVNIAGNSTKERGGGVFVDADSCFTAINATISGNSSSSRYGGGVYVCGGTFTTENTTIAGNAGNGVCLLSGTFAASNTTIKGNSSTAVNVYGNGAFSATNTTIEGNSGDGVGFQGNTFTATNVLIAGNYGSGVSVGNGTFTATNVTIAGNSGGGVTVSGTGKFTAKNAVVAKNYCGQLSGTVSSESSNNFFYDSSDAYISFVRPPIFDSKGKLTNADSLDLRLKSDSCAIDAGSNAAVAGITTDLDGKSRVSNGVVDIGAYEYVYTGTEIPTTPSELTLGEYDKDAKSVRLTWKDNSNNESGFKIERSSDGGKTWVLAKTTLANETSYVVGNIEKNNEHMFRVRAVCGNFSSDWTYSRTLNLKLNAPSDVKVVDYDPKTQKAAITWKDNSEVETGFRVEYSTNNGTTWRLSELMKPNVTSRTAWGLKPNTTYLFRVCAINGTDASDWFCAEPLKTDGKTPNAPSDLTFGTYDETTRSVQLSWKDNSDDETGFKVEYSIDEGVTWRLSQKMNANSISRTAWGLKPNTTYLFRVCAFNGSGDSDWTYSEPFTPGVLEPPVAPSDLTLRNYDSTTRSAELSWKDNSDNETGFKVEYSTDKGVTWRLSQKMSANSTSRTAWGLKPNTTYFFRVCAFNGSGDSDWAYWAPYVPDPQTPEAPSELTLGNYDSTTRRVELSWKDNSDNETGFRVEYSTDGGSSWSVSQIMGENATGRAAWGLKPNTGYLFRVCAFNTVGRSDWTYSQELYTGLKAPSYLTIRNYDKTAGTATLQWEYDFDDQKDVTFRLEYSIDARETWRVVKLITTPNVTSIPLSGLKEDVSYDFRICAVSGSERSKWTYSEPAVLTEPSILNESFDVPSTGDYALTLPVAAATLEQKFARDAAFQLPVEEDAFLTNFDVDFVSERADDSNETELFAELFDDLLAFDA